MTIPDKTLIAYVKAKIGAYPEPLHLVEIEALAAARLVALAEVGREALANLRPSDDEDSGGTAMFMVEATAAGAGMVTCACSTEEEARRMFGTLVVGCGYEAARIYAPDGAMIEEHKG